MINLNNGDIIRFNENAECRAAKFCRKHGITGKIIDKQYEIYTIDVGFEYLVYAKPDQIDRVISRTEVPDLVE